MLLFAFFLLHDFASEYGALRPAAVARRAVDPVCHPSHDRSQRGVLAACEDADPDRPQPAHDQERREEPAHVHDDACKCPHSTTVPGKSTQNMITYSTVKTVKFVIK